MPVIDLGSVVGPQGPQGVAGQNGAQGIQGNPGPNQVTGSTSTTLNGILQGNGSYVQAVASDNAPTLNSNNIVRSGAVYTALTQKTNTNFVDNWYFVGGGSQQGVGQFPINQRGQTSYPAGTNHGVDRWKQLDGRTTVTLQGDGLVLGNNGTGGGFLYQRIRNESVYGKTFTMSVLWYDGATLSLASGTGTCPGSPPSSSFLNVIPMNNQFTHGSGCGFYINSEGNVYVQVGVTAGNTVKIVAIKLEVGTIQSLARQENGTWVLNDTPDYFDEVSRAQLYLRKLVQWRTLFPARTDTTGTGSIWFCMPGTMARNPDTLPSQQVYFVSTNNQSSTGDVTFTRYDDYVIGNLTRGSIPANISGIVMFPGDLYVSAED